MTRRRLGAAASLQVGSMTRLERRAVAGWAFLYSVRIVGLFLLLPLLAPYARVFAPHTPSLIGLAVGVYGLTQALLNIPLKLIADRIGRKPVMVVGLVVFATGSVVAGVAHGIVGLIVGRAMQGAGAISAVATALTTDLMRDVQRVKFTGMLGVVAAFVFAISLVMSSVVDAWVSIPGMFEWMAVLAVVAISIVLWQIPSPDKRVMAEPPVSWRVVLQNKYWLLLYWGVFCLYAALTALFVVLPTAIMRSTGLPLTQQWQVYLPIVVAAFLTMGLFVALSRRAVRKVLLIAVGFLSLAQCFYILGHHNAIVLIGGMWLFFTGFGFLEWMLPVLISRLVPVRSTGAAMSVYSTFQYSGIFVGGVLGGVVEQGLGREAVFVFSLGLVLAWGALLIRSSDPQLLENRHIYIPRHHRRAGEFARELSGLPGVAEVVYVADESTAYLKVDPRLFNESFLKPLVDE